MHDNTCTVAGRRGARQAALGQLSPVLQVLERGATAMLQVQRRRPNHEERRSCEEQRPQLALDTARVRPAPVTAINPNDPVVASLVTMPVATSAENLPGNSPAVRAMRAAGVRLVVPLVSQGELVGILTLGPQLSNEDYSSIDQRLLNTLAAQAAPGLRIAQLIREEEDEARERERIANELRLAALVQQTLLPRGVPSIPGWHFAAHYQSARAVGGDFYDFLQMPDGRLSIAIGDVTDKGVPAALIMATTRSILRSTAQATLSPRAVLRHTNELLYRDTPANMFVTCFYAVLDPKTGRLSFANAGHDLPYQRCRDSTVRELHATGMPLGLMPDSQYEEGEISLAPSESMLLFSDGLTEAHNPVRQVFGHGRLRGILPKVSSSEAMIGAILAELAAFTGPAWEQEDDVTLVTIHRHCAPYMRMDRQRPAPPHQLLASDECASALCAEHIYMT